MIMFHSKIAFIKPQIQDQSKRNSFVNMITVIQVRWPDGPISTPSPTSTLWIKSRDSWRPKPFWPSRSCKYKTHFNVKTELALMSGILSIIDTYLRASFERRDVIYRTFVKQIQYRSLPYIRKRNKYLLRLICTINLHIQLTASHVRQILIVSKLLAVPMIK